MVGILEIKTGNKRIVEGKTMAPKHSFKTGGLSGTKAGGLWRKVVGAFAVFHTFFPKEYEAEG